MFFDDIDQHKKHSILILPHNTFFLKYMHNGWNESQIILEIIESSQKTQCTQQWTWKMYVYFNNYPFCSFSSHYSGASFLLLSTIIFCVMVW